MASLWAAYRGTFKVTNKCLSKGDSHVSSLCLGTCPFSTAPTLGAGPSLRQPLLRHGWSTSLRCSKFCFTYQNKRNRNQCGWTVGNREGAGERFCWKHEWRHCEMCGVVIAYIVSPLPNNHVKAPEQCCLWRGQQLQDSSSVTAAVSSARGTGPGRISQSPKTWFPQRRASTSGHNPTHSTEKSNFLSFMSK